jgi:hypothetical protein
MQKMMRSQIRAHHKRLYADLGDKLGLSPEEAGKLIDLITDQQLSDMERARNQRPGDPAFNTRDKNLGEIAALIGQDKMQQYAQFQESMPARQEVDMLSRQLDGADLTLSKDQRDRMVTALYEERKRIPAPEFSQSGSREDYNQAMNAWNEDYQARASARARSILSSEQLATFDEYQQWRSDMRRQFDARRAQRGDGNVMPAEPVVVTAPPPPR